VHHLDTFTPPELAACHERALLEPAGLVCVSEAVAGEVRAGWGRAPAVIANGVDAARFAAAASSGAGEPWRARYGRYVLAVGGIEPRKGTLELVEAMASVDAPLLIAGGDTLFDFRGYRDEVFARASALGVPLVARDLPVLREVFAGAARFADGPEGFAREIGGVLDGGDVAGGLELDPAHATVGRALAAAHTWDAAAAAHLALYRRGPSGA
jgi:glycosyltransferase involved in cell wall biosynthesis